MLLQLVTAGLFVLFSITAGGVAMLFEARVPGMGCSLAEFVETVVSFSDCRSQPASVVASKAIIVKGKIAIFIGLI